MIKYIPNLTRRKEKGFKVNLCLCECVKGTKKKKEKRKKK